MSLPVLDPRFFTANKPSANFFQKWKDQSSWNEGILPIYEWDGFVYIALDHSFYANHEPETLHAQFPFPHVLLFAPSSELKNIWTSFQQTPKTQQPVAPAPTSVPVSQPPGEQVFDMDTIAAQTPISASETQEIASPNDEIPEGLQINLKSTTQKPATTEIDDPFASLAATPAKKISDETVFDAAPLVSETATPTESLGAETLDLTQISNPSIPNLQLNVEKSDPKISSSISATEKPSEWIESFFDKLNSHFPYSMIFLVNENQAMPWKWSSTLKSEKATAINLNTPSPFYVVNRTQHSYHGPVAESSEVRKLCSEWHLKNYPQHMTASPIKINDRVIGILLAIGEAEHYQNQLLQLCESCADEIAELIQQQPQILKAS